MGEYGVTETFEKANSPFRSNPKGVGNCTTTLRWLLIGIELVLSLSSYSIKQRWFPVYSLLPGNDTTDKLARRQALLVPSAISCSLSPLISRIHSSLFSHWRRTDSSKFFDTTGSLDSHRGTCAPSSRLLCSLSSSLQWTQPTVKLLFL